VFAGGKAGSMFHEIPHLFNERNMENLLVFADRGEIVSHVGMVQRWACLAGCTVRVACIGAVSTYEEHRGRGLATRLFEHACAKAAVDGVDFMMISGSRRLYLRAGAAHVGRDAEVTVSADAAEILNRPGVTVGEFIPPCLPDCTAAYAAKEAHFIRPADDWRWFLEHGHCMCTPSRFEIVLTDGAFSGYFMPSRVSDDGEIRILEFAGEPTALAAALNPLMERCGARSAKLHLQSGDSVLRSLIARTDAVIRPATSLGTVLLINTEQFMNRLRPYFERRVGAQAAETFVFEEKDGRFEFELNGARHVAEGKAAAAELIFRHCDKDPVPAEIGRLFPVPSLWYGLTYA